MCGIAGAFGDERLTPGQIERALLTMSHRGPDASGAYSGTLNSRSFCLLHARLSVIDLDPRSNQPFVDDDLAIAYNGEIYNYLEIRAVLESEGCSFRTHSDTEVLIKAWRRWGPAALDKFEGMWAFALVDMKKDRLILSRDRFGEKPLFVTRKNKTVYFASEVKTLAALTGEVPEVNDEQVRRYLVNGYKALYKQPRTWFKTIDEVPQSHWLEISPDFVQKLHCYWTLSYKPVSMTLEQAEEETRQRLDRSLALRLRSDVPIAFCLSGGIDSSTLVAIAAKRFAASVHAFSIIENDERYDERQNIRCTAGFLGCKVTEIQVSPDGFWPRMERLIAGHDAPVATLPYYMHSFISEAIHDAGIKVAISGTGADELFTGYYDHYNMWLGAMHGRPDFGSLVDDWKDSYGAFVRNPLLQDPEAFWKNPAQREHIFLNAGDFDAYLVDPLCEAFAETDYGADILRSRMLNELFHESVPVILKEDDLNSMMFSVENRVPFLDRSLAEFAYSVPPEHLIKDGHPKWLLRAAGAGILPDQVRLDKRKRGFNLSILSLVNPSEGKTLERLLADGPIWDLVKREKIEKALKEDLSNNTLSKFLFSFISARLFLDRVKAWRLE